MKSRIWPVALTILLFAVSLALLVSTVHDIGPHGSYRTAFEERLGAEATKIAGAHFFDDNSVDFRKERGSFSATYELPFPYEIDHLLAHASTCKSEIVLVGRFEFTHRNGFIAASLADRPFARARPELPLTVVNPQPHAFFLSPLYQPITEDLKLPGDSCRVSAWRVQVIGRNVLVHLERVRVQIRYLPSAERISPNTYAIAVLAALIVAALFGWFFWLFGAVHQRFGTVAAIVVFLLSCLALFTHDEWDFQVWQRFVDLAAFGHANPIPMWFGSPLWPALTSVVAPVVFALHVFANDATPDVSAVLLKLLMAASCGTTAVIVAATADATWRKPAFWLVLLSPALLFDLQAGYRETIGSLFLALGVASLLRRRYAVSVLMLCVGACIAECLLPSIMLPAVMRLLHARRSRRAPIEACVWALFAFALVAANWLLLAPPRLAQAGISWRASNYRLGGAAWQGILSHYGILPSWVHTHGLLVNAVLFAVLALPPFVYYVRTFWRAAPLSPQDETRIALLLIFGLECAFFLSYTGIDPNNWYSLVVLSFLFVLQTEDVRSAVSFPLMLGMACGLAFYAIGGLSTFMSWSLSWPVDVAIFGVLGEPLYAMIAFVNLIILSGLVLITAEGTLRNFAGPQFPRFALLFFFALVASSTQFLWQDVLVLTGIMLALMATLESLWSPGGGETRRQLLISVGTIFTTLAQALELFFANPRGLVLSYATLMMAWSHALCVGEWCLAFAAAWLLAVSPGYGFMSFVGYVALLLLLLSGGVYPSAFGSKAEPSPDENFDRDRPSLVATKL